MVTKRCSRPLSGSRTVTARAGGGAWVVFLLAGRGSRFLGVRAVDGGFCGGHGPGVTPGPFPNPEAKAWHGDGTAPGRVWESNTPPHSTVWTSFLVELGGLPGKRSFLFVAVGFLRSVGCRAFPLREPSFLFWFCSVCRPCIPFAGCPVPGEPWPHPSCRGFLSLDSHVPGVFRGSSSAPPWFVHYFTDRIVDWIILVLKPFRMN